MRMHVNMLPAYISETINPIFMILEISREKEKEREKFFVNSKFFISKLKRVIKKLLYFKFKNWVNNF